MKIELNEPAAIGLTISIVVLVIACLTMGVCYQSELTRREAIKAGLVQKNDTTSTTRWDRP